MTKTKASWSQDQQTWTLLFDGAPTDSAKLASIAGLAQAGDDKGIRWLEREGPPTSELTAKLLPQDWLAAQLLRREAEKLLDDKQSP